MDHSAATGIVYNQAIVFSIQVISMNALQEILEQWQTNLKFREEFKKNPVQALKNAGLEVSPEDLAKIESTLKLKDNNSNNEALNGRINK